MRPTIIKLLLSALVIGIAILVIWSRHLDTQIVLPK